MLIELRVENHRSVRDEQALTMEVGRLGEKADPRPRVADGAKTPILSVAALYGANGSGKSNILSALEFMRISVLHSHRSWPPEDGVPREPFAWGQKKNEPSLFEVTVIVDSIRYQYGFVVDDERFLEEWLYAWPVGRKQTWFERDGDEFKFGEHLSGENRVVEQVTRPNALFLSAAVQHRHEQLSSLYRWFHRSHVVNVGRRGMRRSHMWPDKWLIQTLESKAGGHQQSFFEDDEPIDNRYESFRDLLRAADVGIVDFRLEPSGHEEVASRAARGTRIMVRHASSSPDSWLPLSEESQGTLTLFQVAPSMLQILRIGGLLVVDELEASLHPLLALQIVQLFNNPSTNPSNAQLLFTTHDTNLLGTAMGEAPLRRDQVWLTEKDNEGASCIYPLTDYKPRKSENLERGYLQGRYGAIPFLGILSRVPV